MIREMAFLALQVFSTAVNSVPFFTNVDEEEMSGVLYKVGVYNPNSTLGNSICAILT